MFLQWRPGQTKREKGGALSRRAHQYAGSPSTRASNVSDASDSPQGASPAMSYAMSPPHNAPVPYPSPTVNHAQQPLAGPQAPTPPQQQQHGQGQQGGQQGGGGGQTPRLGANQSPYTSQGHPQPGAPHPHPHPQAPPPQNPQLRADVVKILANTTNQCITDANHQERARIQHLEEENRRLHDTNTKLFQDNTKLNEVVVLERQQLAAINLTQTQQGWMKAYTDLQNQLGRTLEENKLLNQDVQTLTIRCNELNTKNHHLQTQGAASSSELLTLTQRAYEQTAAKLAAAEQRLGVYHAHGQTCPSFQQQFAQYARHPQRTSSQPQPQGQMQQQQQQPVQGYSGPPSTMPPQQYAHIQQRMMQQQQRRASTSMIVNVQRDSSQPGTPIIASATMSAPPGAYSGGRPISQPQNAGASSSRPPSAQPGQPTYILTPAQTLSMGPPQHGMNQPQQNQLHVRTPSQSLTHVNGVMGVGPNGLPRPQSSGGRSNSGIAQPLPIQNSQGQSFAAQQAALNARVVQQQQRFQQQYGIQQQPAPSPTGQVQVLGSLQQPVPTKPHTPVYNSRAAPSPSPQIFSNALMHSISNSSQPGLQNVQSHSRSQSVISISSSSRPNSSASMSRTQMQAPLQTPLSRPPSAVNAAQAGLAGALNQQVQGQYQGVSPRPQSQNQNAQIEMMQHYQNLQQQRIQQQQQAQQQPPQPEPQQQPPQQLPQQSLQQPQQSPQQPLQEPPQQQPSQLAPQQQPSQPHSHFSTPLIPVRPSPETQPPPPSGSTDGSFVGDQAQTSPSPDAGGMIAETNLAVEEAPSTPMAVTHVGASAPTVLAAKRGSVVLESSGEEESRKKMRMSEEGTEVEEDNAMNVDVNPEPATSEDSASSMITTAAASATQSDAGGEDDVDEEDDEEEDSVIGPDGLRTVESCLEGFFVREGETRTCRMCLGRHAKGLISAPVSFKNAQDQDLVNHCLAEHDVAWNTARHDI